MKTCTIREPYDKKSYTAEFLEEFEKNGWKCAKVRNIETDHVYAVHMQFVTIHRS